MGKKYIIELEPTPFTDGRGRYLYRVKGFNSLVFDEEGLNRLAPYEGEDMRPEDEFAVGDEIMAYGCRGVVFHIDGGDLEGVTEYNDHFVTFCYDASKCKKTGRHFEAGPEAWGWV